jgi:hypothetical protein
MNLSKQNFAQNLYEPMKLSKFVMYPFFIRCLSIGIFKKFISSSIVLAINPCFASTYFFHICNYTITFEI